MLQEKTNNKFVINADFPFDDEGRVHHVGVKSGEIANHIITVGDSGRAWRIAQLLDEKKEDLLIIKSTRGFLTITGHYNQLRISIVAIGMGNSMMDFFVREIMAVVEGMVYIVRIGSCGTLKSNMPTGSLVLVEESAICTRNYNSFLGSNESPYNISKPVSGSQSLIEKVKSLTINNENVFSGLNITTDSFYSSQGRISKEFEDKNDNLIKEIKEKYPNAVSLEMETFMLYHLAHCSLNNRIFAFAIQIVFADRENNIFINAEQAIPLEITCGKIILQAFLSSN